MNKSHAHLTVIEGGKSSDEVLFQRLRKEPHHFAQEEFERTIELFRERLTIDDILDLIDRRVRNRDYASRLEQQTLLAIIEGRDGEVDRLFSILERRNKLSLKIISSS
ncbi:MAG: hypothetical protein ACXWTX_03990 [Gallionella sp.]